MSTHPFRAAVESGRFDTIGSIFTEDGVLHSPITHRPYHGRKMIATVVATVAAVLDDFRFVAELDQHETARGPGMHALMFRANVDELQIQGCDFVHTDQDGLIDEITVMMRPLKAVAAFANRMRAELPSAPTAAAG